MKHTAALAAIPILAGTTLLAGALPANAANPAIKAIPNPAYLGSSFDLKITCPSISSAAMVQSSLFGDRVVPILNGEATVRIELSKDDRPGRYDIALACHRAPIVRSTVDVKAWSEPTPAPGAPATPRPAETIVVTPAGVIVETGFGGMAHAVASHHPR